MNLVRMPVVTVPPQTVTSVDMLDEKSRKRFDDWARRQGELVRSGVAAPERPRLEWRAARDIGQSLSSGKLPYDAAVLLANISSKIYGDGDQISCRDMSAFDTFGLEWLRRYCELFCIKKNHDRSTKFFEVGRSRAVGFTMDGYAFVVFRGTDPCSLADWWTDLECWGTGRPYRHAGFSKAWHRISQEIRHWLAELPYASHGVVLSGHSLGGAMAILAAYDLSEEFPVAGVITFGAPRVGGLGFRRAYNTKHAGPDADARQLSAATWRFVNKGDLVSAMPPALVYYHVGHAIGVSPGALTWAGFSLTNDPKAASAWLHRLEYLSPSYIPPEPSVPTSADWWSTLKAFAFFILFVVPYIGGVVLGPVGWLLRALILSGADHPAKFYVGALPLRREQRTLWEEAAAKEGRQLKL